MTEPGAEEPPAQSEEEPPHGNRNPEPFWDLKASHWVTAALTAAIFGVGIAQFCVYRKQAGIMSGQQGLMQGQLDQMVAQQRPWISAKVEIIRPVEFYEWNGQKGINVTLHFSLKNFGPSPATNISIRGHIWPHPGNSHADLLNADQNIVCEGAQKATIESKMMGPTIFPGEQKPMDMGVGNSGVYSGGEFVIFSIQGCIDYTYNADRHGKTGFRMLLASEEDNRWVGIPFYIPLEPPPFQGGPRWRDVSIEEFKFGEDGTGGNYAK